MAILGKVLSMAPFFDCTRSLFEGVADVVSVWGQKSSSFTSEELEQIIRGFDACVVWLDEMSEKVIESGDSLKAIGIPRAGFDNVDVEKATERGIPVVHAPGANSAAVADYTIGMIISLVRGIALTNAALKRGAWNERWGLVPTPGYNLEGKKLGLVGLGNVGSRVALRARAFGMDVLAYNSDIRADKPTAIGLYPRELCARLTDLDSLLKESDIVSIHVPLLSETRNMIGERELRLMKKTAYLINVSRGGVIDDGVLIRALEEKWIAGAALDVFDSEPLSEKSELLKFDNVILTPHIAWCTAESISRSNAMVASSIANILKGKMPDVRFVANASVLRRR